MCRTGDIFRVFRQAKASARRGVEHAGRTRWEERENTKKNYKYVLNSFSSLVKVSFMHLFIHLSISLFIHLFTYLFITYFFIHLFIIVFFSRPYPLRDSRSTLTSFLP